MSYFHLFLYPPAFVGRRPPAPGCELVSCGLLHGTLYEIEPGEVVLMLYGNTPVEGDVWRCPAPSLPVLDRACTRESRLVRVARRVTTADLGDQVACWLYVAGPALAKHLLPERRIPTGAGGTPTEGT